MKLWHARRTGRGWVGGLFFVGRRRWMLLERIVYIQIRRPATCWPLLLVFLGGYMVWQGFAGPAGRDRSTADAHLSALGDHGRRHARQQLARRSRAAT